MIRQALGRAIREQHKSKQEIAKKTTSADLTKVITQLLPAPQPIQQHVEALIDLAVTLANSMAEEQALFRSQIIRTKRSFKEDQMYVPDDKQSGRVYLCTFPSFYKTVANVNGGREMQPLVLGSVELESLFR